MAVLMKMLISRGQSPASHPNRTHSSAGRRAEVGGEEVSFSPNGIMFTLLLVH